MEGKGPYGNGQLDIMRESKKENKKKTAGSKKSLPTLVEEKQPLRY
jgi:hypothetical protein